MEFIRRHPNSIVSASVHLMGKNVLEFIQLNRNIKVGDKYVDFTQPDSAGKNVSVSDLICRPQPSQSSVAATNLLSVAASILENCHQPRQPAMDKCLRGEALRNKLKEILK